MTKSTYISEKNNNTRRPRCSRILLAKVRKASSMFIFSLQDTSKKGISKFSAIFCPLSASTALCAVTSHLFAATTFTTSGEAFCKEKAFNCFHHFYQISIEIQVKLCGFYSFLFFSIFFFFIFSFLLCIPANRIINEILSRILTS